MKTVKFIQMQDGTREEYAFLDQLEKEYNKQLPDRLIEFLKKLEHSLTGYRLSRLGHSLQAATRAHRAGEDMEVVMAALFHDVGDDLAPYSHSEMAAAILRPYVSEQTYWIVKHHGTFQMYYYADKIDGDKNARDIFKDHPFYDAAVNFCKNYDQNCFDPDYDNLPLDYFEPMIKAFFSKEPKFHHHTLSKVHTV